MGKRNENSALYMEDEKLLFKTNNQIEDPEKIQDSETLQVVFQ